MRGAPADSPASGAHSTDATAILNTCRSVRCRDRIPSQRCAHPNQHHQSPSALLTYLTLRPDSYCTDDLMRIRINLYSLSLLKVFCITSRDGCATTLQRNGQPLFSVSVHHSAPPPKFFPLTTAKGTASRSSFEEWLTMTPTVCAAFHANLRVNGSGFSGQTKNHQANCAESGEAAGQVCRV